MLATGNTERLTAEGGVCNQEESVSSQRDFAELNTVEDQTNGSGLSLECLKEAVTCQNALALSLHLIFFSCRFWGTTLCEAHPMWSP